MKQWRMNKVVVLPILITIMSMRQGISTKESPLLERLSRADINSL
jgi:hypothetical protein